MTATKQNLYSFFFLNKKRYYESKLTPLNYGCVAMEEKNIQITGESNEKANRLDFDGTLPVFILYQYDALNKIFIHRTRRCSLSAFVHVFETQRKKQRQQQRSQAYGLHLNNTHTFINL